MRFCSEIYCVSKRQISVHNSGPRSLKWAKGRLIFICLHGRLNILGKLRFLSAQEKHS